MNNTYKALAWAAAILIATFVAKQGGMSDSAAFALIIGLAVAAVPSLRSGGRAKACLREIGR